MNLSEAIDDDLLSLYGDDLATKARCLFQSWGGTSPEGHRHLVDILLMFEKPFHLKTPQGDEFSHHVAENRFAIEVKSHEDKGARVSDLRQVYDWALMEETRRLISRMAEIQRDHISPSTDWPSLVAPYNERVSEEAYRKVHQLKQRATLAMLAAEKASRSSQAEDQSSYSSLDFDGAFDLISIPRTKGLLVVNHYFNRQVDRPTALRGGRGTEFALANNIAVLSWSDMLLIDSKIKKGEVEPFSVFCYLFDLVGLCDVSAIAPWKGLCKVEYSVASMFKEGKPVSVYIDKGPMFTR